ncbi:MAG: (2Fe-2S)-binding protein [Stellaceae bacterium]
MIIPLVWRTLTDRAGRPRRALRLSAKLHRSALNSLRSAPQTSQKQRIPQIQAPDAPIAVGSGGLGIPITSSTLEGGTSTIQSAVARNCREAKSMPEQLTLNVNGADRSVAIAPDTPLLYVLRDNLGLHGPKFGCGLGECGACTVIMNGAATRSCVMPAAVAKGSKIVTLEGLGTSAKPHPVQKAFITEQAAQCGYCINGMIMTAAAFLESEPHPTRAAIVAALDGNLCRCGTHMRIVRAVERAARERA